jgi:ADP-ribosylglycohydrolase/fructose-1,6-bisphosphatase/inositol monophosphatase family enzyme
MSDEPRSTGLSVIEAGGIDMTESRYMKHIELARFAALEAGEVLRRELHRAGGPRGVGSHAPVDEVAQELICRRLLAETPLYGLRCEERSVPGRTPADDELHCWVVDPNDGTSSFLEGRRGAAVSIALLRTGRPVLGVVYSYAAPDDDGDLFTWAEGDDLRRNGEVVRRTWPGRLSEDSTVLLSAGAADDPVKYARQTYPARFRALPSIAYRLALVAAGEADLAVSTNGPVGWDYAAGHALLLGAGGDLFDKEMNPVTYSADGVSSVGSTCVGGIASLANQYLEGSKKIHLHLSEVDGPRPPATRASDALAADASRLSRAQGCLLGQLCGDALGAVFELQSARQIARAYPEGIRKLLPGGPHGVLAGQPTDDSELALSLARAIVSRGSWDPEVVATSYARWLESGPFDVGNTTGAPLRSALTAVLSGEPVAAAARAATRRGSSSNGALMRISPLGIFGHRLSGEDLERFARADAELTHPHPDCVSANVLLVTALAAAIGRGPTASEVHESVLERAKRRDITTRARRCVERAATHAPRGFFERQGDVAVALQNAFYQLLHAATPAEGLIATVARGGDTDTNAAIAGALLGAVHGLQAWPASWRDRVLSCRPLGGLPGVGSPRPRAFWPVDALDLAERLLVAGESAARSPARASGDGSNGERRLSGPYEADNLEVFLIHAGDTVDTTSLQLLPQLLEDGTVVIRETHSVRELVLDNHGSSPVLCLLGDMVKGGAQDRVVAADVVIAPGVSDLPLAVFCVEQARWGARGREDVTRFSQSVSVAPSGVRRSLVRRESQHDVWSEVESTQTRLARSRGSSLRDGRSVTSLQLTLEHPDLVELTARCESKLARLADAPDAVGHVVVINGVIRQAEWYGSSDLHRRLWPRALHAFAVEAAASAGEPQHASPSVDKVAAWIDGLLAAPVVEMRGSGAASSRHRTGRSGTCVETLWPGEEVVHVVLSM